LELSTSTVDFGTVRLGADAAGTPQVEITNCSALDQTVFARGTDATGIGAAWDLIDFTDCTDPAMGVDNYGLRLSLSPDTDLELSVANRQVASMASGALRAYEARISTACPGSAGSGVTMSMQIVFLATE
jgi:hypothetical protein